MKSGQMVTTRVDLEVIVLSDISKTEKDRYPVIYLPAKSEIQNKQTRQERTDGCHVEGGRAKKARGLSGANWQRPERRGHNAQHGEHNQ